MKAYKITCEDDYEGMTLIRFGDTAGKAKAKALHTDEFHDADLISLRATRAPEFDGRENNPPTLKELVEEFGWYTTCTDCEIKIDRSANPTDGWDEFERKPHRWLTPSLPLCESCSRQRDQSTGSRGS